MDQLSGASFGTTRRRPFPGGRSTARARNWWRIKDRGERPVRAAPPPHEATVSHARMAMSSAGVARSASRVSRPRDWPSCSWSRGGPGARGWSGRAWSGRGRRRRGAVGDHQVQLGGQVGLVDRDAVLGDPRAGQGAAEGPAGRPEPGSDQHEEQVAAGRDVPDARDEHERAEHSAPQRAPRSPPRGVGRWVSNPTTWRSWLIPVPSTETAPMSYFSYSRCWIAAVRSASVTYTATTATGIVAASPPTDDAESWARC